MLAIYGRQCDIPLLPPVEFGNPALNSRVEEPLLESQGHEEMCVWMFGYDSHDCRMIQVIIMTMRDDYGINRRDLFNLTWNFGIPFWAQPAEGAASTAEDRIEKHAQPSGELDKVARVTKPGCS